MPDLKIPNHVAIIMDGNGRWAEARGKSRTYGHKVGADTFLNIVEAADQIGIKYLSIYSFSTENFKRPKVEVDFIMDLIVSVLKSKLDALVANNVKILFSGRREGLPQAVLTMMDKATISSKDNTGIILNVCLNYGSHLEIIDMVSNIVKDNIQEINEKVINKYLYQDLPPVDLLIRTSGEQRISNFMLWQIAYAELYFTDTYWPDFNKQELQKAITVYQERDRRFGGLK